MKLDKGLIAGSSTLLVLSLLEKEDMYGYQMITELSRRSNDTFQMKEWSSCPRRRRSGRSSPTGWTRSSPSPERGNAMGEKQERTPAEGWLDKATAGIRFGPDRKEVRRELEEHLEDKALDFQRIFPDLTAEEAKERAASEMGDPAEIGKELAKVHRPWLGYLWRVSQVVLGLACLSLLWSGMVFYSAFSVDDGQVFLELWDVDGLPMTNEAIEAYDMFGNGLTPRETYLPSGHPDQLQVWEDGPALGAGGFALGPVHGDRQPGESVSLQPYGDGGPGRPLL